MSTKPIETLEVQDRQEWRRWLHEHYDAKSAKRPETKEKRLREALELLALGKKLGMK